LKPISLSSAQRSSLGNGNDWDVHLLVAEGFPKVGQRCEMAEGLERGDATTHLET